MKYLLSFSFLMMMGFGALNAQDKSAVEYKNEGNTAYNAKDYKKALGLYEQAIAKGTDPVDVELVYATATCARKVNADETAVKYYSQSIKANNKADISTYYLALSYKALGQMDEYEKTLVDGIKTYSTSKYLSHFKKELVSYYVIASNDFYTKGNDILKTRLDDNRDQWDAIKESAKVEYDQATDLANKALKYDAKNENAKTILNSITTNMSN